MDRYSKIEWMPKLTSNINENFRKPACCPDEQKK